MATMLAMPSHPATPSFAAPSQAFGAYGGCGAFDALSVYPAARGAVWTTPYVHSAAPMVAASPPQQLPAVLAQAQQGTLLRPPVAAAVEAPATPDAASMQAALAHRMRAQEEEAAALAWLRVKPINLPPLEPMLGAEPSDEQFAAMFWEERRLPRVHCFGAFTQHSFAPTARYDGVDGIFTLPDLGPF